MSTMRRPRCLAGHTIHCIQLLGYVALLSSAVAAVSAPRNVIPSPSRWSFESKHSVVVNATKSRVIDESANPGNQIYELPETVLRAELRPDWRLKYTRKTSWTLRPRLRFISETRQPDSGRNEARASEAWVNEGFMAIHHTQTLQSITGLQNFQWGPAELASPSNPLFTDIGLDKDADFETRGQALMRFNYTPTATSSVIALAQPLANGAERQAYEGKFQRRGVVKVEIADATQTNYMGLVLAAAAHEHSEQGLYGSYEILPAWSVYADAMMRHGSRVWYPELTPTAAPHFAQTQINATEIGATAVFGTRYVSEGGSDWRLEYMVDDSGWSLAERQLARTVLALNPSENQFALYLKPGTMLPGREFYYVSLRIPEWGWRKSFNQSLHLLRSATDGTAVAQVLFDTFINENLTISAAGNSSFGVRDGELTQGYAWSAKLGAAWTF